MQPWENSVSYPQQYSAPNGYRGPSAYPQHPGYWYPPPARYPAAPQYLSPPQTSSSGPLWISLVKHTGMLVLWHHRSYRVYGTLAECERAYRSAQIHNLTAGWWSPTSALLMNWVSLLTNALAMRKLRRIAQQSPTAS
jgi:hypothetical protein